MSAVNGVWSGMSVASDMNGTTIPTTKVAITARMGFNIHTS